MSDIEQRVLRIADSDLTWFGLGRLRPAPAQRVGLFYIILSSILLGLPGVGLGAGLIYAMLGKVESSVWLVLFILAMAIELPLHFIFAHYWNRRAERLGHTAPSF